METQTETKIKSTFYNLGKSENVLFSELLDMVGNEEFNSLVDIYNRVNSLGLSLTTRHSQVKNDPKIIIYSGNREAITIRLNDADIMEVVFFLPVQSLSYIFNQVFQIISFKYYEGVQELYDKLSYINRDSKDYRCYTSSNRLTVSYKGLGLIDILVSE